MFYHSTRSECVRADSAQAVLDGLAPDGGLYMQCLTGTSLDMSCQILSALLPDIPNMPQLVKNAYTGRFETAQLTPTAAVGDFHVLELFRGPTSAFKDVALSMLPQLLTAAKTVKGMEKDILILTATSGDTGKAALEGFHDVKGTRIIVFYPYGGVSAVQQAQMATQTGNNVKVCAVRGNFDDAQTGVKQVFAACKGRDLHGAMLSSANSINIGRLAPQVVYYFRAYGDLVKAGRIALGDKVNFVVPTGNFGDILAGYFAKELGLPVGRLVCASNANDVLTEFIATGRYDRRRPFYKTTSPSMDILVSSNLERLLFLLSRDPKYVAGLMGQLNTDGAYQLSDDLLAKLQQDFSCGCCDDQGAADVIGRLWREQHYLCDPHTAVAWAVAEQLEDTLRDTGAPTVVLSTHTGGFGTPARMDGGAYGAAALEHYHALGLEFECIYTGYLGGEEQVALAEKAFALWPNARKVVDPVMGDNGKAYSTVTPAFINRMRKLTAQADLILPNATEAALLLQKDPAPAELDEAAAQALADALVTLAHSAVVTGLPMGKYIGCAGSGKDRFVIKKLHIDRSFPGTGDLYGAVLLGSLIQGNALSAAADNAAEFVALAIQKTPYDQDTRFGVWFEPLLPRLCPPRDF